MTCSEQSVLDKQEASSKTYAGSSSDELDILLFGETKWSHNSEITYSKKRTIEGFGNIY